MFFSLSAADLPDLRIIDAQYNRVSNQLNTTVVNASETPVEDRDIEWSIEFEDGTPMWSARKPDAFIRPWGTTYITCADVQLALGYPQSMLGGYTVVVDFQNQIAEEDEDNNRHAVPGSH